jgi:hypothetical protein
MEPHTTDSTTASATPLSLVIGSSAGTTSGGGDLVQPTTTSAPGSAIQALANLVAASVATRIEWSEILWFVLLALGPAIFLMAM